MSEVIRLYEPAIAPKIPSKVIGRAELSWDTWQKIGGVGVYHGYGPMKTFRLALMEPMFAAEGVPSEGYPETMTVQTIICEAVPIWRKGRYTFEWRAVVPKKEDREMIATLKGKWRG